MGELFLLMLATRQKLCDEFARLHRKLLTVVKSDEVCKRLMTIAGVGPVVSLAFISTIDTPARFRKSKAVGPAPGLMPALHQDLPDRRQIRRTQCQVEETVSASLDWSLDLLGAAYDTKRAALGTTPALCRSASSRTL